MRFCRSDRERAKAGSAADSTGQEPQVQIGRQRDYYARRRPARMLATDTPYVRRHFHEAAQAVALQSSDSVCEWGAGMGRFTRLFAQKVHSLTAIELSPELAEICRASIPETRRVRIEIGDILEVAERLERTYSVVAGFFVLHHLRDVEPYFHAARRLLLPGGRFVCVEPNPLNPLYAAQITLTPGMRWREEAGIYRMWPSAVGRSAAAAGFRDFATHRYGALPYGPYNIAARFGAERWTEYLTPRWIRPFQLFSATRA